MCMSIVAGIVRIRTESLIGRVRARLLKLRVVCRRVFFFVVVVVSSVASSATRSINDRKGG